MFTLRSIEINHQGGSRTYLYASTLEQYAYNAAKEGTPVGSPPCSPAIFPLTPPSSSRLELRQGRPALRQGLAPHRLPGPLLLRPALRAQDYHRLPRCRAPPAQPLHLDEENKSQLLLEVRFILNKVKGECLETLLASVARLLEGEDEVNGAENTDTSEETEDGDGADLGESQGEEEGDAEVERVLKGVGPGATGLAGVSGVDLVDEDPEESARTELEAEDEADQGSTNAPGKAANV